MWYGARFSFPLTEPTSFLPLAVYISHCCEWQVPAALWNIRICCFWVCSVAQAPSSLLSQWLQISGHHYSTFDVLFFKASTFENVQHWPFLVHSTLRKNELSSMHLFQVSGFQSFLWLNNIPLNMSNKISWFIHRWWSWEISLICLHGFIQIPTQAVSS